MKTEKLFIFTMFVTALALLVPVLRMARWMRGSG